MRAVSWKAPERWTFLPRNVIVYDGPSQLTGAGILVIAGWQTMNRKIGEMLQLWILTRDISPIAAVRSGADDAICGNCRMRGDGAGNRRACYVEWWRAPENIHQARAKADRMTPSELAEQTRGMQLRIGAYGDPVAVPLSVWLPLLATAGGWTAYTHQWATADSQYRSWCMASVDSPHEQRAAAAMGWRTFRVRPTDAAPVRADEVICPASEEGGHKAVCADCSLCRGSSRQAKHVVIAAHSGHKKWFPMTPVQDDMRPRLVLA